MEPIIISMGGKFQALGLALFLFFFIGFIAIVLIVGIMNFSSLGKLPKESYKKLGVENASEVKEATPLQKKGQLILAILLFFFMSTYMIPPFFEFNKVVILPDNTWKLKNGWNITVGTISPTTPRDVQKAGVVTTFTNTYRRVYTEEIHIVAEGHTYRSVGSIDNRTAIADDLSSRAEKINALKEFPVSKYYTYLRYTRYTLIVITVAVGYLFWRKK